MTNLTYVIKAGAIKYQLTAVLVFMQSPESLLRWPAIKSATHSVFSGSLHKELHINILEKVHEYTSNMARPYPVDQ